MAKSGAAPAREVASDVIAAVGTPLGSGAVGMVRLSGEGSLRVARRFVILRPDPKPRSCHLAWAMDGPDALDQVLATHFPAGSSYTGEEMVELSCHGSSFIVERLLSLCLESGARLARPGEFTQRAYLNGRLDLAQAEAVCELICARTKLAHRAALTRLEGGLSREVAGLRARLLETRALVEAALDHPDEDIPLLTGDVAKSIGRLGSDVAALARRGAAHLRREAPRVAIVGLPNAGKSSLLNALLGRGRAIVSNVPGTTRDTIEESADLDGLQGVLIDTAGLRDAADDPVEREGVERSRAALASSDLALVVIDRALPAAGARDLLASLAAEAARDSRALIAILNKSDIQPRPWPAEDLGLPNLPVAEVSALRGDGLPELAAAIRRTLSGSADPGHIEANARHRAALDDCVQELSRARDLASLDEGELDLAAFHLSRALDALDQVAGAGASDELLAEIFSRFCVGK